MNADVELTQITDSLNSGILILDLSLKVLSWNRFLALHANKNLDDFKGESIFDVFPELPKKWFERKVASVVQLGTPTYSSWEQRHHLFELPHTRPITTENKLMAQNCSFLPYLQEGTLAGICLLIEDVTDVCHYQSRLKEAMDELERASRIDGLTQIYNRRFWEESLSREFCRCERYKTAMSLILFDLDHFKRLNDTYGHQCGDMVLEQTAACIKSLLRDADIFGRYGGEEFAIILPETRLPGAAEVAERVRKKVAEQEFVFEGDRIQVSISLGVAELSDEHQRYEQVISSADNELYRAKSMGRNQICVAQQLTKCS
ncbi:diguanylate cyclase [Thalassotalea euphylliae]|uniref:sensor domain-containing diguanylate cyclase n=1 Tax=Thalassotalea euphylliae TaxID=1655234 RepID=UPI00364581BB